MDIKPEIRTLNFGEVYKNLQVGDQITIYNREGKHNCIIIDKSDINIGYKNLSNNEITNISISDFLNNTNNIYDIVYEHRYLLNDSLEQYTINLRDETKIGTETYIEAKAEWEQIFPLMEQKEDLYNSYILQVNNPSKYYIESSRKRAETFYDLVDFYQDVDIDNNKIYKPRKLSTSLLQYDLFKDNNFISNFISPIIDDQKFIFSHKLLSELDSDTNDIYVNKKYYSNEEDDYDIKRPIDFDIVLKQIEELNYVWNNNKINYDLANQYLYGDNIPHNQFKNIIMSKDLKDDKEIELTEIPLYRAYKPSERINNVFRKINNTNDFFAYRYKFSDKLEKRLVYGKLYKIIDIPDSVDIDNKCQTCSGTAKLGESGYSDKLDKYVASGKTFNKKISREPILQEYVSGENINICGFLIKNPKNIVVDFNPLIKLRNNDDSYFIYNYGGYWNTLDRNSNFRLIHKKITDNLKEVQFTPNLELDYLHNNYITFDKELSNEDFNQILKNLIPNQHHIFNLEYENISNATNFTTINKILSKYFLSIKNLTLDNYNKIIYFFKQRVNDYTLNAQIAKTKKEFYNELNIKLNIEFKKLYESLFQISNDVSVELIAKLLNNTFTNLDNSVLKHILNYYFNVNTHFNNNNITLLAKLIYEKYIDYINNKTAFTLLFYPSNLIPNQYLVKLIYLIKEFYNISNICIHSPKNISVINELLFTINNKDGGDKFKLLLTYLYTLQSIQNIKNEEEIWLSKYNNIDNIKSQIENLDSQITNNYKSNKCFNYKIKKVYKTIDKLSELNPKVDNIFSENFKLKEFLDKNKDKSSSIDLLKKTFKTITNLEELLELYKNGNLDNEKIVDGDYCLLVNTNLNIYNVYRRENNNWIYNSDVLDSDVISIFIDEKLACDGNIKSLCKYSGKNIKYIDGISNILGDCELYENMCLTKEFSNLLKNRENLYTALKAFNYFSEQKLINNNLYNECLVKISEFNLIVSNLSNIKTIFIDELKDSLGKKTIKNNTLEAYKSKFYSLKQIVDEDLRFTEIEKFITNHGLPNRKLNKETGNLDRVNYSETDDIYWDIPNTKEKLCCKHWLLLVKQAYQDNNTRKALQETLENMWSINEQNAKYKYCKNCREIIGNGIDSDHEGFNDEGGRINFREGVLETTIEESLKSDLTDREREILELLKIFTKDYIIEFTPSQINEILVGSSKLYSKYYMTLTEFEKNISNKSTTLTNVPFIQDFIIKNGAKYEEKRNAYIGVKTKIDLDNYSEFTAISSIRGSVENDFYIIINTFIKPIYDYYLIHNKLISLWTYIILVLYTSYPEVNILVSDERKSRMTVINPYPDYNKYIDQTVISLIESYNIGNQPQYYAKKSIYYGLLKSQLENSVSELLKIDLIKEKLENKSKYYKTIVSEVINRLTLLDWKTFRPYLRITQNVDLELEKLDLNIVDKFLKTNTKDIIKLNYYASMLSNKLFYLIYSIISQEIPLLNNTFSNYCCLSDYRELYFDNFKLKNNNIGKILDYMNIIQSKINYNPNENLVMVYDKNIIIKTPYLFDYINNYNLLNNKSKLENKIRKLVSEYVILDDEPIESIGLKRLYSIYYDPFLLQIGKKSNEQILNDLYAIDDINANDRYNNLFDLTNRGLIMNDILTNKYHWNITNIVNTLIKDNSNNLLKLYYNLVDKINNKNVLNKSNKLISSYYFNETIVSNLKLQTIYLKNIFSKLKEKLNGKYNELELSLNYFINLTTDKLDDLDTISKLEQFCETAWKPIINKIQHNSKIDSSDRKYPEWFKTLFNKLDGIKDSIEKEIIDNFNNQLLIEGYFIDSNKLQQINIRTKDTKNKKNLSKLQFLKNIYILISSKTNLFKNIDVDGILEKTHNSHESLNTNSKFDVKLDNYLLSKFFKDNLGDESLDEIREKMNIENIDNNLLLELISFDDLEIFDNPKLSLFNNKDLANIFLYLIYEKLTILIKLEKDILVKYITKFIWENELEYMIKLNSLSELEVNKHLRSILSRENDIRKQKFSKLSDSDKIVHKIVRNLGLGKNIIIGDGSELDDEELAISIEKDYLNEDVENDFDKEDIIDKDKDVDDDTMGEDKMEKDESLTWFMMDGFNLADKDNDDYNPDDDTLN